MNKLITTGLILIGLQGCGPQERRITPEMFAKTIRETTNLRNMEKFTGIDSEYERAIDRAKTKFNDFIKADSIEAFDVVGFAQTFERNRWHVSILILYRTKGHV
ncbi:MAG: hypothetical protein HY562_09180 [Ignavibacteriales bacterium]|nr:hypothetical protein [Ignavibacteriales bacterium]